MDRVIHVVPEFHGEIAGDFVGQAQTALVAVGIFIPGSDTVAYCGAGRGNVDADRGIVSRGQMPEGQLASCDSQAPKLGHPCIGLT